MKNIKEIIKDLKAQIDICDQLGEDPDDANWNHQTGVVISANDAKVICEAIEKLEINKSNGSKIHK